MKKIKIFTLLASLCTVVSLSGCKEEKIEGFDDELKEVPINSLYDGMVALYQTQNYSFEVILTSGSYRVDTPDMIFTKKYIGFDGQGYEDLNVYYNDGNGIYHVTYAEDFLAGEYLADKKGNKYDNLWNNAVVDTMLGVGGAYIKQNVTSTTTNLKIEDKDYQLQFLKTFTGSTSKFANVEYLNAKYENGKVVFDLKLDANAGNLNYKLTMKNVGTTASSHLKMFVSNDAKPFVPNDELKKMRELLYMDNYIQRTDMVYEGEHAWMGYQFYTEHYFFTTGNDTSVGTAYMEFDHKAEAGFEGDIDMWGIYMINVSKDENGSPVVAAPSQMPYNSSTIEVEDCVRYPSRKLDLLNNLEYVKAGEIREAEYNRTENIEQFEGGTSKYYFTNEALVKNFVENFSLNTAFEGVIFSTIAFELKIADQPKDSMVCFHAIGYYAGDGVTYDIIIPIYGFGEANRSVLDNLYNAYNK